MSGNGDWRLMSESFAGLVALSASRSSATVTAVQQLLISDQGWLNYVLSPVLCCVLLFVASDLAFLRLRR